MRNFKESLERIRLKKWEYDLEEEVARLREEMSKHEVYNKENSRGGL
ncbi:hypothetical protein [Caudoviricetes sp.]|nr:hypothetical protein [Caudoviricetes sp.]